MLRHAAMIIHGQAMRMLAITVRCHGARLKRETEADNSKDPQGAMCAREPLSLVGRRPNQKGISVSARVMSLLAFIVQTAIRASTYSSVCSFLVNQR